MGGDGSGRSGGRPTVEESETNKDRRAKMKDKVNARPAREAVFGHPGGWPGTIGTEVARS
jgi:hypothetical protein